MNLVKITEEGLNQGDSVVINGKKYTLSLAGGSNQEYLVFNIDNKIYLYHRCLMYDELMKLQNPENYNVHHIDMDKTNNLKSNLKLIEKGKHTTLHLTGERVGDKHPLYRHDISNEKISSLFKKGMISTEIANELNCDDRLIRRRLDYLGLEKICKLGSEEYSKKQSDRTYGENNPMYGRRHSKKTIKKIKKTLNGKFKGNKNSNYRKDIDNNYILELRKRGLSQQEIANELGCCRRTVMERLASMTS